MRIAVFSSHAYDRESLGAANARHGHELVFFEARLASESAALAAGFPCACAFVHDRLDEGVIAALAAGGTRFVALRAAGFNNVDLAAAAAHGVAVASVPAYSPNAVAEHTIGLILSLDRKTHRAHARVREGNFSLEGLEGFDLAGKTVGVVGTGKIGAIVARILVGFGCRVLAADPYPSSSVTDLGASYVSFDELIAGADIVTLHAPLTPQTRHLIDRASLARMKPGVMLINTSRGALVDTEAVVDALKSRKIGYLGLDVYEEEADLFFQDLSNEVIQDDVFARLLTFPNVLVTAHQAYFTHEALANIAETTLANVDAFERGERSGNEVTASVVRP